jgi:hypothetical protein
MHCATLTCAPPIPPLPPQTPAESVYLGAKDGLLMATQVVINSVTHEFNSAVVRLNDLPFPEPVTRHMDALILTVVVLTLSAAIVRLALQLHRSYKRQIQSLNTILQRFDA